MDHVPLWDEELYDPWCQISSCTSHTHSLLPFYLCHLSLSLSPFFFYEDTFDTNVNSSQEGSVVFLSSIYKHGGSNGIKITGETIQRERNKAREKYKGNQIHRKRTKFINRVGPTCMVVSCDQPLKPASCSWVSEMRPTDQLAVLLDC